MFFFLFSSQYSPKTELRRALFKYEIKENSVDIIDLKLLVHSNQITCRKRGRLGLDPVLHLGFRKDRKMKEYTKDQWNKQNHHSVLQWHIKLQNMICYDNELKSI